VSLDITQRKETESEQVRLREEAVRASRAKDDFLATLSHELRTPLNPVLLVASDAAQDADFPPAARASFELIRKNVELEARLIDDLLDLTTIVRGKLVIRKEAVDVHTILSDAIAAVQPEFEAKRVALTTSLAAGEHTVFADEVRLVQVFINLLKNAVKFTSEQGRVELHTAAAGSGRIKIHLSDTGIGMTVAELERVFGAFEQGDHATEQGAHRFGGLGLGLAISQRLVELHGGTIQAFSEGRDRGTSFTIELPLHRYSGVPSVDGNPPLAAIRELNATAENRILLVEDHEPTRRTLAQLLRRRNYSVSSAASLAEAREQAAGATFDLVV
jgi:signal transduction histidine kinase